MSKMRFICLLIAAFGMNAVSVFAQEGAAKAGEGTLNLSKKTYQLAHAVAYESSTDGEGEIAVVLSAQPISREKLKKAVDAEKKGESGDFPKPFIKLVFKKSGKMKNWTAMGGSTTIGGSRDGQGEVKVENGHAVGQANEPLDSSALIPKGFDVRFNVALLKSGEELAASAPKKHGPAANVKPTVTGIFKANGKDANLAYVSASWGEPFAGKPGIVLVFTEKDHSKAEKPETEAMFGKFGSALIVSLHEEGDIYGCQVEHTALKHGFSSSGSMESSGFTYADGKVEGELTTNGPVETFGDNWEVKLKFTAPLGEIPKEFQAAESTTAETKQGSLNPGRPEPDESESTAETSQKPAAPDLKVKDLALTKDATDIEYKALVEQMSFKSKSPVKSVCAELAKNLKGQGWASDGSDLVNANSSILKRKRGQAELTIFVKPDNGGSTVTIMSRGLAWE